MMKTIVEAYKETLTLLQVESFPNVLEMFDFRGRKNIALKIVEVLLENNILVPSVEEVSWTSRFVKVREYYECYLFCFRWRRF